MADIYKVKNIWWHSRNLRIKLGRKPFVRNSVIFLWRVYQHNQIKSRSSNGCNTLNFKILTTPRILYIKKRNHTQHYNEIYGKRNIHLSQTLKEILLIIPMVITPILFPNSTYYSILLTKGILIYRSTRWKLHHYTSTQSTFKSLQTSRESPTNASILRISQTHSILRWQHPNVSEHEM